ncbi:unnamed protein product [Caenorhabditis brenneri]
MDSVDIIEQLKWPSLLQKTNAFLKIAEHILESKLDPKSDKEFRKILFDCFYKYGEIPLELLLQTLPALLQKLVMTREEILSEFTLRIDKIEQIQRTFPAVLNASIPSFSNFLAAASKIDPEVLTTMFVGEELQNEHYRYILVLIFSGLLNDEQKRRLGNMFKIEQLKELFLQHHPHLYLMEERKRYDPEKFLRECPTSELESHPLDNMDFIQRLHLMYERPAVLRNPNIGEHVLYMPFMFLMIQYIPNSTKVLADTQYVEKYDLKTHTAECQSQIQYAPMDFYHHTLTLERFISYIVTNQLIAPFVSMLEFAPESLKMFIKPWYLPAVIALLPHCHENDRILKRRIVEWISTMLKEIPAMADAFILYFLGIFQSQHYQLDHYLILDFLVEVSTTVYSYQTAARFMFLITTKLPTKAFECLSRIIDKYPAAIPVAAQRIRLSPEDSEEEFRANMSFLKDCCLGTDDNDEYIAKINECLKDNGFRLGAAVDALYDLVKNDVLELVPIRKQLQKKVKSYGNEAALVSYCNILSLGAIQQDEESEEDFQNRKITYIQELHEYTCLKDIGSAAWKALGEFQMVDLEAALKVTRSSFGETFTRISSDFRPGYIEFLKKQLKYEKESYQRPLYNTSLQTADLPPLLTKIDNYKENLTAKNNGEAWFWTATLPLSASILQLSAPSNKAQTAVRLLKGCLLNVPTADSVEEMLRHMAGWRICVREALNALCESKSNDLLWARDQIVQEGRLSLTQKSESVDNIMMMLTVLADCVEEKLRLIDDKNLVDEVGKAQKPWTISVFEFVATRLPKEMKEKREQRVNPIYQVMTQSNKSSLHTAIFCVRLLGKHSAIMEFYRNEQIDIAHDPIFESFFGMNHKLQNEQIPNRNMLWITAEAYGADELTAAAFEREYLQIIDEKSPKKMVEPSLSQESIKEFFANLVMSSKSEIGEIQANSKKVMEKIWNNGTEEVKKQIYEGLAELALISGSGRKRTVIPIEKISDSTLLRGILEVFDEKHDADPSILRGLLKALPDHQRSDGRFLPPVDWLRLLKRAEWQDDPTEQGRLAFLKLACEQQIPDVVFYYSARMTVKELSTTVDNFKTVSRMLPRRQFMWILKQLTTLARCVDEEKSLVSKISETIASFQKDPIVHLFLTHELPRLVATIGVTDPILNALKEPLEFAGGISRCFDVWLEARNGEKMNIKRIYDLIQDEDQEISQCAMYALVSFEARKLNTKQKIDKILDVVTVSRIHRSANGDLQRIFILFLSIIVSLNDEVDIPVCWFGSEPEVVKVMSSARKPFFKVLLESEHMRKVVKHIGSFLRPYCDGDESELYPTWQKTAAQDMLCTLMATFGADALESLMEENDEFWQSILPVE